MKKMLKKANIGSGNTINIGGGGDKPMAFRFGSGALGSKDKAAREKLKHIVSKEALNIDGLGKKVVENFWKLKLIKKPHDLFNLNFDMILNLSPLL